MRSKLIAGFLKKLGQICLILLVTLGVMGIGVPVLAESAIPEEVPRVEVSPFPNLDASTIPSEKISQFVHACVQVVQLIERREGELQGAETELESQRIEQEIEAEASAIIAEAGLTRQEYLQMLTLANIDPEFGDRVTAQLQEANN